MKNRSVSDLVGYVFIFSLVASTVGIVSVAGFAVLEDAREFEQTTNAERAFDVMADNFEDIYAENAPSRATEITLSGASIGTTSSSTINVSWVNESGSLVYRTYEDSNDITWNNAGSSGTSLVYSFGVVYRTQSEGGIVLEEGPLQISSDRTIISIVELDTPRNQRASGGTVRVRGVGSDPTREYWGNATKLRVNVTSSHPGIWRTYLGEDMDCLDESESPSDVASCTLSEKVELYLTVHPIEIELER